MRKGLTYRIATAIDICWRPLVLAAYNDQNRPKWHSTLRHFGRPDQLRLLCRREPNTLLSTREVGALFGFDSAEVRHHMLIGSLSTVHCSGARLIRYRDAARFYAVIEDERIAQAG